ncbi:MAG TPA: RnfABCDGE type electron transport complex subunit G [Longimicrobiales bacterium]|nr:RnfABCDGE type electron transport complex subunit G [Longimicrobiales bacterium]
MGGHVPKESSLGGELAPDAPVVPPSSAARLVLTLMAFGIAAGFAVALAFRWADPRIQAHQAMLLRAAITEVLKAPDHYTTLFVDHGRLTDTPPAGADTARLDRVYLGFDAAGKPIGFAIAGGRPGFQDEVRLIFGYDARTRKILGMKVIDHRETPGIGDKIEKDSGFVAEFQGPAAPLEGVKAGRGNGNPHAVDMITGATISSRAVLAAINARIQALGPALDAYVNGGGR